MRYYNENCTDEELKKANALDFYTPNRLDIGIRMIMLERYSENTFLNYYKHLYGKLILFRNGGYEPNEYFSIAETKNGVDDYIDSAYKAYRGIMEQGFKKEYFIPVNEKKEIIDGSHRIASALLLKQPIWYRKFNYGNVMPFSYNWFIEHGFNNLEMLIILKKYGQYKNCKLHLSTIKNVNLIINNRVKYIGHVKLQLSVQCITMIKKQLEIVEKGYGIYNASYSEDLYLWFIETKEDSVLKRLENQKVFLLNYTNYVNEVLNLNSLLYFKKMQVDWQVIDKIREVSQAIEQNNIEEEFFIGGQIIAAMFHVAVKSSVYLIVNRKYNIAAVEKLVDILSNIGTVTLIRVEDIRNLRWEENHFTCYTLHFLSIKYIVNHRGMFNECDDAVESIKIFDHMNDFCNIKRKESIDFSHYITRIDKLDVSDWSV